MTRIGDIWYHYDNRTDLCRAGYVGTWDGCLRFTLDSAVRHKDRNGWTLRWRDSSGARIVGVQRGDNDIVRVRGVTVAPERVFQPRFVAYARVHGRAPQTQLEHDKDSWPGAPMCGFVLWNTERWREWRATNGYRHDDILPSDAHGRYDSWIAELPVVSP